MHKSSWTREQDELKSTKKLVEEMGEPGKQGPYTAKEIPLVDEEGYKAYAYVLPDAIAQYGGRIREVLIDSTCE
jgi:hypothetical protein